MAGRTRRSSSSPNRPASPAWGLRPATATRGAANPNRRASASAVSQIAVAIASTVNSCGTSRRATWVVATVTRSRGPASIIANSRAPARAARYSVWPGNANPARAIHSLEMGAVTSAAASPARTASVAAAR